MFEMCSIRSFKNRIFFIVSFLYVWFSLKKTKILSKILLSYNNIICIIIYVYAYVNNLTIILYYY